MTAADVRRLDSLNVSCGGIKTSGRLRELTVSLELRFQLRAAREKTAAAAALPRGLPVVTFCSSGVQILTKYFSV